MSYCIRSRGCQLTVLDFKSWAINCIDGYFHQHFTAHAQKRLFMNFRCKIGHHRSILWPRFLYTVWNFSDLAKFSNDFCTLYAESLSYFYFQFVWLTDLESIPHASTATAIISTKFEVDRTIHCRVLAFLLLIRYVTLTFWPWTVVIHGVSHDQPCHKVGRSYAYEF